MFERICSATTIPNGSISISSCSLEDFPIVIPQEKEYFYIEEFNRIANPYARYYSIADSNKPTIGVETDLANELMDKIRLNNESLIKHQIEEDIEELNICFNNKAYKATLILAGSILEAFLLDWISEIHGVNYFDENNQPRKPEYYYEKNGNKHFIRIDNKGNIVYTDERADLADYIDEIKLIKRPNWMQQAKDAHKIRKKRNLVHAKLCLRESVAID